MVTTERKKTVQASKKANRKKDAAAFFHGKGRRALPPSAKERKISRNAEIITIVQGTERESTVSDK